MTKSDEIKLRFYTDRLRGIFDRDLDPMTRSRRGLEGMEDYIMRSAIEALRLDSLFYEPQTVRPIESGIEKVLKWNQQIQRN